MAGGDRIQPQPPCCLMPAAMSLLTKPSLSLVSFDPENDPLSPFADEEAENQSHSEVTERTAVQGLGSVACALKAIQGD